MEWPEKYVVCQMEHSVDRPTFDMVLYFTFSFGKTGFCGKLGSGNDPENRRGRLSFAGTQIGWQRRRLGK